MIYLLPWKQTNYLNLTTMIIYTRFDIRNIKNNGYVIWGVRRGTIWHNPITDNEFKTKEEAMLDYDRYLISKGYYLISEDQAERLKLLL